MAVWLSEQDVRAVLSPLELIGAMEAALTDFSAGRVLQPVRTALEIGERSFFAVMPALYRGGGVLGAKLVTVVPANAGRGLHTHQAAIALFDPETGRAGGNPRRALHHRGPDGGSLGGIGEASGETGVVERSRFSDRACRRPAITRRCGPFWRSARSGCWSPTREHREGFAEARPETRAAGSAEEAVRGADVVVVATSSVTPAIASEWVADGAHVIAIGACRPTQREVDPELVARAALFVDSRAAALQESGDVVQSIAEGRFGADHIRAELGEVAGGAAGRRSPGEVTLFKSLGLAVEDVAAAGLAFRRACAQGLGRRFS